MGEGPDEDDGALGARIARTAGEVLLALRRGGLYGAGTLGKAGDQLANVLILRALREARPDDAILSEESVDDPGRLDARRVWIVDPLDGTREYAEGRPDWAVHVALTEEGRTVAGAVALPDLGLVHATGDGTRPTPVPERRPRMLVSRSRPAREAEAVAAALDAEIVPMGSAGAKACAVLRGEADLYLHSGGQYEWDTCAPAVVALAASLHVSRIDGSRLAFNKREPLSPDLVICRPDLAPAVLAALRAAS